MFCSADLSSVDNSVSVTFHRFLFLFCVSGVCSVVFDCFWLSVPVQLVAWEDSSPK